MRQLEIHAWEERGQKLLERAKEVLENAPNEQTRALCARLPQTVRPGDDALRIVFAGQYSAGKSSILKVLTGKEDIAIGAAITTQQAHTFDWNGVVVVDTPGIHTEERPDHDAITYDEISRADLLVFVVTNELFDSHLAEHFRTLAIERDKGHEMLLVVNKMMRTAKGNTPVMQQVIQEDLAKVVYPFTPEELRISFIDAQAALDSQNHPNEKLANILIKKSGFQSFIGEFNDFIRDKEIASRYTTALYVLEQVLQEALSAETSGDIDVDGLEELFVQKRNALLQTKMKIPHIVNASIQKGVEEIRSDGRMIAELIHLDQDSDRVNTELQEAQDKIQGRFNVLSAAVESALGGEVDTLQERLEAILDSELSKQLVPRLTARAEMEWDKIDIPMDTLQMGSSVGKTAGQLGAFLVKNSFNGASGKGLQSLLKLQNYSGTPGHEVVKSVGHLFGKSFKPWEAIKWTRNIAHAGRILSVVGPILTIGFDWKLEKDAEKRDNELRESRIAVQKGFNEQAATIETHFDKVTQTFIADFVDTQLDDVDGKLKELNDMQTAKSETFDGLVELLEDTRALIHEMHQSQPVNV